MKKIFQKVKKSEKKRSVTPFLNDVLTFNEIDVEKHEKTTFLNDAEKRRKMAIFGRFLMSSKSAKKSCFFDDFCTFIETPNIECVYASMIALCFTLHLTSTKL